jgi:hypothetical protein
MLDVVHEGFEGFRSINGKLSGHLIVIRTVLAISGRSIGRINYCMNTRLRIEQNGSKIGFSKVKERLGILPLSQI